VALMRVFPLVAALSALLAAGCGNGGNLADQGAQPDHQAEWRDVLEHKKVATSSSATVAQKQVYADSVRAFVQKHPNHGRGREVWERIQLEFADELAAHGRYRDALRFYRSVLTHDPMNLQAQQGLELAVDRLAVTREKLLTLEKGMSQREVAGILGKPLPGWTETKQRSSATIDAWYYQTRSGGVAGVYFRDGKVFAAEESSNAREGRLGS
jgi:hypothetical protein